MKHAFTTYIPLTKEIDAMEFKQKIGYFVILISALLALLFYIISKSNDPYVRSIFELYFITYTWNIDAGNTCPFFSSTDYAANWLLNSSAAYDINELNYSYTPLHSCFIGIKYVYMAFIFLCTSIYGFLIAKDILKCPIKQKPPLEKILKDDDGE